MSDAELERLRDEYRSAFRSIPQDSSHPWHPLNPAAIYYRQAREQAVSKLLRTHRLALKQMRCIDIGCGYGAEIGFLVAAGASPPRIHGIELVPERARNARSTLPLEIGIVVADAGNLPYPDHCFDLATQYTVFSSIKDPALRKRAADEIWRVLAPGGYLIWYDMHRTRSRTTTGIALSEIQTMFPKMELLHIAQIHSPYTTRLVNVSPILCFLWDAIAWLPKTHYLILLKKPLQAGEGG